MKELTKSQLREICPSAFAPEAHSSTSGKYLTIHTESIIDALQETDLVPVKAQQSNLRKSSNSKEGFQHHRITFRSREVLGRKLELHEVLGQITLDNSYDAGSSYLLRGGLHRCWCSNQCTTSEKSATYFRIRHLTGSNAPSMDTLVSSALNAWESTKMLMGVQQQWASIELDPEQASALATIGHTARFPNVVSAPVTPDDLLIPRRNDDTSQDLWTVQNVIQENCIKGMQVNPEIKAKAKRYTRAKPVKSFSFLDDINAALWDGATEIQEAQLVT